jgi:hypothetical protein
MSPDLSGQARAQRRGNVRVLGKGRRQETSIHFKNLYSAPTAS